MSRVSRVGKGSVDLFCEDPDGDRVAVEKADTSKTVVTQVLNYLSLVKKNTSVGKHSRAVLVCKRGQPDVETPR